MLVDVLLGALTLLHLFLSASILTPVDSPLKKPLVKVTYYACRHVLDNEKLQISCLLLLLAVFLALLRAGEVARACCAFYVLTGAPVFMKSTHLMRVLGPERTLELEQEAMEGDILEWTRPNLEAMNKILTPYYCLFKYEVMGLERIPEFPCFYVMNHSLYGLEMPCFIHMLYQKKDVYVRGLADHMHWMGPHGPLLRQFGAVDGSRRNVDVLMSNKQNILVYPGGGQEILKPKSAKKYELMWKERLGFARMAIKNRYPIMPCACVGPEDMLDILFDLPMNFLQTSISTLPVAAPNSLQKLYFWFGEPIATEKYQGEAENKEFAKELRDKTREAVERGIRELQERQETDPDRFLMDRVAKDIRGAQLQAKDLFNSLLGSIKAE